MILEAKMIHKDFPPLSIIKGIDLSVRAGESVAIMGKSGEGKSTLLHILGTLEPPTKGFLKICGKVPTRKNVPLLRNRHIGFIFQSSYLFEGLTALKNVMMPLEIARQRDADSSKKARAILESVGLGHRADTPAKYLSGGEKQRVAAARSLINEPELLLADEPTGNLDESCAQEMQLLLFKRASSPKRALILVTHNEKLAQLCDHLFVLKEGRLYNSHA